MKRIYTLLVLLLFFLCICMIYYIRSKTNPRIFDNPNFDLISLTGEVFDERILNNSTYKLFVFFSTECDLCKSEISTSVSDLAKFKNLNVFLVASESFESVINFYSQFDLMEDLYFIDPLGLLMSSLEVEKYPTSFLYDERNKTLKKYEGHIPAEKVQEILPIEKEN